MKMRTKEIAKKLPKLYAQDGKTNPMVHVKFFCPWNKWTWYATEGQEDVIVDENGKEHTTWLFYGYVVGHENELGYFSLLDLESVRGPAGLKIERDLRFSPTLLDTIKAQVEK
jgi:hypothetical protein